MCRALLAGNSPASISIDNQVLLRDEKGLLKDRFAKFAERQKPLVCRRETLLEQAWMRLEVIRSAHLHVRDGLDAGLCCCDGGSIEKRLLRGLLRRRNPQVWLALARMRCFRGCVFNAQRIHGSFRLCFTRS